jgi:glutamate racemase
VNTGSIGVFDSGVGGLSLLREIRRELPHEDVIYVADSGYAPYGDKPVDVIRQRSSAIVEFLVAQGAKAVVVACNTATSVAVDGLRSAWTMPIVAIEPAVKPAAATTRSGVVGVLATSQTIASQRFARLTDTFAAGVAVVAQPCPGLVEQIEHGDLSGPATRALIETYVRPLIERGADTLVLGCTHYPFVRELIADVAGPDVAIVDPAAAVARELRRRLEEGALLAGETRPGRLEVWSSGNVEALAVLLQRLGPGGEMIRALPV